VFRNTPQLSSLRRNGLLQVQNKVLSNRGQVWTHGLPRLFIVLVRQLLRQSHSLVVWIFGSVFLPVNARASIQVNKLLSQHRESKQLYYISAGLSNIQTQSSKHDRKHRHSTHIHQVEQLQIDRKHCDQLNPGGHTNFEHGVVPAAACCLLCIQYHLVSRIWKICGLVDRKTQWFASQLDKLCFGSQTWHWK